MKKILFLGMNCVYAEIKEQDLKGLNFMKYTGKNADYARKELDGSFSFFTEKELANDYLNREDAVYYKGNIFFKEEAFQKSKTYLKFKAIRNKSLEYSDQMRGEYLTYLNGALYNNLIKSANFAMVQSMIELYKINIFTLEMLESKLNSYLKPNTMQFVVNELFQDIQKAG